jgi:7-cyano-7-deazaguanine reductase
MTLTQQLGQLGQSTTYVYDRPDVSVLEWFPSPFADAARNRHQVTGTIHIEAPEFTTLCPITGQPDFATIVIDYTPNQRCVESKSLKLYLGRFRQEREFHEACINRIANDLIDLLAPNYLKVEGRFTPRGGIPLWPAAEYRDPSYLAGKG